MEKKVTKEKKARVAKKTNFIVIENGIQPVFYRDGFAVAEIKDGNVLCYYGTKEYKTYNGALKASQRIEARFNN